MVSRHFGVSGQKQARMTTEVEKRRVKRARVRKASGKKGRKKEGKRKQQMGNASEAVGSGSRKERKRREQVVNEWAMEPEMLEVEA